MNKAQYRKVSQRTLAGDENVMVQVKNRGSNNPRGRKASKYAGSVLRVVRTTGENRCSLTAFDMERSISLHYAELILLDDTLPLTHVVRKPDPIPQPKMPSWAVGEVKWHEARIRELKELRV